MSVTRREHYQRAQKLLARVKDTSPATWTPEDRDALAVAQVHATLAAADSVAAGEAEDFPGQVEHWAPGGEVVVPVSEVKRVLQELEAQDSVESTRSCAGFVWRSLFGEVMP